MIIRKALAGGAGGYHWLSDGAALDVPDELGLELLAIRDGGFSELQPDEAADWRAAVEAAEARATAANSAASPADIAAAIAPVTSDAGRLVVPENVTLQVASPYSVETLGVEPGSCGAPQAAVTPQAPVAAPAPAAEKPRPRHRPKPAAAAE